MGSATVQGQLWGRAAHDWAELQEPLAAPLWEAMLAAAGVGPGTRVLDAGCGAGGASVLAASRGARVNGLDAAAALLAIAILTGDWFEVPDRGQQGCIALIARALQRAGMTFVRKPADMTPADLAKQFGVLP